MLNSVSVINTVIGLLSSNIYSAFHVKYCICQHYVLLCQVINNVYGVFFMHSIPHVSYLLQFGEAI